MNDLVILGAGGFGREVFAYAQDAGRSVAGFVDDDSGALDAHDLPVPVLGDLSLIADVSRFDWVIGLGDPDARKRLYDTLAERGASFASVVHPTAYIARSAVVGPGSVVAPFALVAPHARVGADVVLNTYASVGHDAVVGEHCVFSPYAVVNGTVHLGAGVFLGTGAMVGPGLKVGQGSKISVGAGVTRDLEAGSLAVGNPAKGRVMFPVPEGP